MKETQFLNTMSKAIEHELEEFARLKVDIFVENYRHQLHEETRRLVKDKVLLIMENLTVERVGTTLRIEIKEVKS